MKYYLDSDVWIVYMDDTEERHTVATKLFEKIIREKGVIVVSGRHFVEMGNKRYFKEFDEIQRGLWKLGLADQVSITAEGREIAFRYNEFLKVGYNDCLHVILARKCKARAVSFDKHWKVIGMKIGMSIFEPEELLLI